MKRLFVLCALVLGLTVGLSGCNASAKTTGLNIAVMPAEGGDDIDPADEERVNEDFRLYLEETLGVPVTLQESTEYSIGITALAEGNIDALLVSPMSYYQATQQADVEPLVTYSTAPGSADYTSSIITLADNDEINQLSDLEGTTFAFVDQASSSGYLYPKYMLINELGLDSDQLENAGYYFDSVSFSGGHPNSIVSVLNGGVEAAAVATSTLDYIPQLVEGASIDDVKIIATTPIIPNPLYIMRSDLDQDLKDSLKQAYLDYDNSEYFEVIYGNPDIRFEEADADGLEDAKQVVTSLGVEAE